MDPKFFLCRAMPSDGSDDMPEGKPGRTRVIASTATPDRYGDVVDQATWVLDRFLTNPVILWGHDYSAPPVGRAVGASVVDGALQVEIEWDAGPHNPLALTVASQFKSGMLSAVSVGFAPGRAIPRSQMPKDDPRYGERGFVYYDNELLEVSAVSIPANPEALALSRGVDGWPPVARLDVRAEVLRLLDTDPEIHRLIGERAERAIESDEIRAIRSLLE